MNLKTKIKLLFTGDWHLRGNNPRNRTDDYMAAADLKLSEVFKLAQTNDADAIIMPGDVWDRPEVAIGVLLHYADVLKASPVPIYATCGNHDIYGYNLGSYGRSSLLLLEMLVPQLTIISDPSRFHDLGKEIYLTATPYSGRMDIDGYGYDNDLQKVKDATYIHIAHGMLLDHKPPFDRYSLVHTVPTTCDLVLTGHDHIGYGVYRRPDGVTFCNPGALMRMSASVSEIERTVQVALITVDRLARDIPIQLIPLVTAKPGDAVLDRSKIEEEKQRQYAMEAFSTLIQTHTGGKVLMDINHIVDTIAAEEGYDPEVVRTALAIIDQQREGVKT